MTLTLTPDAEGHLLAVADQRGLSPDAAFSVVLAEARLDFDEAAAVREGPDDLGAGDKT